MSWGYIWIYHQQYDLGMSASGVYPTMDMFSISIGKMILNHQIGEVSCFQTNQHVRHLQNDRWNLQPALAGEHDGCYNPCPINVCSLPRSTHHQFINTVVHIESADSHTQQIESRDSSNLRHLFLMIQSRQKYLWWFFKKKHPTLPPCAVPICPMDQGPFRRLWSLVATFG